MIVPQFWAEARVQHREGKRQLTVRRFGWSESSQEDAQAQAETRAQEALQRIRAGEKLLRREPKLPYNGADGVPIREEVLARHGDTVITRNAYGAHCLNTPDVLFADIDHGAASAAPIGLGIVVAAAVLGWVLQQWPILIGGLVLAGIAAHLQKRRHHGRQGPLALQRIEQFVGQHPDWHLRVYETPAGYRVLAMQRRFDPHEPAVDSFFKALGTDPVYARMCRNQKCFRARLTPKPWRIGVAGHLRPRPGVWPVKAEHLPARQAWISDYEQRAEDYAACRLVKVLGAAATIEPAALAVQTLHDRMCRAESNLPLA